MSTNKIVVPEAKAALEQFKMEAANEEGVSPAYYNSFLPQYKLYTYHTTYFRKAPPRGAFLS